MFFSGGWSLRKSFYKYFQCFGTVFLPIIEFEKQFMSALQAYAPYCSLSGYYALKMSVLQVFSFEGLDSLHARDFQNALQIEQHRQCNCWCSSNFESVNRLDWFVNSIPLMNPNNRFYFTTKQSMVPCNRNQIKKQLLVMRMGLCCPLAKMLHKIPPSFPATPHWFENSSRKQVTPTRGAQYHEISPPAL